jgi:hypothetical protein
LQAANQPSKPYLSMGIHIAENIDNPVDGEEGRVKPTLTIH